MDTDVTREPVLAPIVDRTPRLLRTERLALRGVRNPARSGGLILTLEIGRLWILPGDKTGELAISLRAPSEESPAEAVSADEEDPWWALLGSELRGAWSLPDPAGGIAAIELQFRPDHANPKLVSLALLEGQLLVSARPNKV